MRWHEEIENNNANENLDYFIILDFIFMHWWRRLYHDQERDTIMALNKLIVIFCVSTAIFDVSFTANAETIRASNFENLFNYRRALNLINVKSSCVFHAHVSTRFT